MWDLVVLEVLGPFLYHSIADAVVLVVGCAGMLDEGAPRGQSCKHKSLEVKLVEDRVLSFSAADGKGGVMPFSRRGWSVEEG